ncbi:MAG TPA: hypothetical protein VIF57_32950 [Polyangia bacterium]|jgi:hypothetical protein
MAFKQAWTVALVWLAGCGGALSGGGRGGEGGGSVGLDAGFGTGGDSAAGGRAGSGTGQGGAAGAAACPTAPATNDPECHPEDTGLWSAGFAVPALRGDCTPGLTCEIPVGTSNGCDQALGLQTYVCCPAIFPTVTIGPAATMQSGFVPGGTLDACPKPLPDQDPACALPLAASCPGEGLQCVFESAFGAGSDAGCFLCDTQQTQVRCCAGVWVLGTSCPADGGMD